MSPREVHIHNRLFRARNLLNGILSRPHGHLGAHIESLRREIAMLEQERTMTNPLHQAPDAAQDLLEALELCLEELDSCDPEFEGTHYCGRCDSAIDRNHEIREKAARAIAKVKGET